MPFAMSFSISSTPVSQPVISPRPGNSIVHPIHKSGFLSDASNFRPISIVPRLPQACRKDSSAAAVLLHGQQPPFFPIPARFPLKPLNRNRASYRIRSHPFRHRPPGHHSPPLHLLDLSKCFDVIDHAKLLSKLQTYSIDPTWFSSYLHGHTICLYSWRAWEPPLIPIPTQSYRCIPGILARTIPIPDLRQWLSPLRTAGARGTRVGFVVCREPGRISLYYVALPPSRPQPIGSRKLLEPRSRSAVHRDENFVS